MSEPGETRPLSRAEEDLKAQYVASRGYWSARMERLMRCDPEYFAAYTALSGVPLQRQSLPPKYAELILSASTWWYLISTLTAPGCTSGKPLRRERRPPRSSR